MEATDTSYGSRYHRPCVGHGGASFVSCSNMASPYARKASCIADSWMPHDLESIRNECDSDRLFRRSIAMIRRICGEIY